MILIADGTLKFDTKLDDSGFVEGVKKMSSKQIGLQNSIKKTQQEISKLEKSMNDMRTAKVPTQEYQEIQKQITDAQKKLDGFIETEKRMQDTGANLGGSAWKNLQWKIEDARQTIRAAKLDLKELESSGNAYTVGGDTSKLSEMQNKYTLLKAKLSEYKAKLTEVAARENQQVSSGSRVSNMLNKLSSATSKAWSGMKKLGSIAGNIGGGFLKLANTIGKASNKLLSGIKKIGKGFTNGQKSAKGYSTSIKGVLRSMILYQGLSKIIRSVASIMWSALKTNKQFTSSLAQTKGNLYTAFQPILTAVMPAINTLMQGIVKVTGYLAQFTSMLFGKTVKSSQEAAKAQYNQAQALKDTSKSAKDANKQLSVLDELNNSTDDSSSDNGSNNGIAPDFDTNINASEGVSEFANKFKEAWKTADFSEIGSIISGKINDALNGIDWNKIQNATEKIAKSIYTFINGFVDNLDWRLVGESIGNGINTSVNFAKKLINGTDWSKLGDGIGNALDGAIKKIDWVKAGKLISDGINSIAKVFNNFYKSVDWVGLGKSLATGVNTAISNTNWAEVGTAIGNKLNIAIGTAYGFITNFNWNEFGSSIATGINNAIATTDWKKLAEGASKLVIGLLDTISTALKEIDWQMIGNTIGDMIVTIDWLKIAGSIIDLLVNAFNGLVSLIFGIGEKIGRNIADGLRDGISLSEMFKNLGKWIKDHIFSPIINNIKKLFGIHSPSTVMAEIGVFLMQGLANGIVSLVDTVKNKFKKLVTDIKGFFTNLPTWFEGKFGSALDKIKEVFSLVAIKNHFNSIWNSIKSCFSSVASWFKDTFSKAWENVRNVFSTGGKIYDGIKEGIANTFSSVVNKLIDGINTIISVPFNSINGMLNKIRNISILGVSPFQSLWGQNPLSVPKIPKLATGTVVPKNYGEFMAILGDNKREAEVVSPISTIEKAVENVLSRGNRSSNGEISLHLTIIRDGKKEYDNIMKINKEQAASGNLSFALN